MNPLSKITSALVAGATNLANPVAAQAYADVKALVLQQCVGKPNADELQMALTLIEKKPSDSARQQMLQTEIEAANLNQSPELMTKTQNLLLLVQVEQTSQTTANNYGPTNTLNANDIKADNVVVGTQIFNYGTTSNEAITAAGLSPLAQKLYGFLNAKWFDLSDLQDMAFQLDIDWDSLIGGAKPGKARSLLQHCEKHNLLLRLQSLMRLARPNLRDQLQ